MDRVNIEEKILLKRAIYKRDRNALKVLHSRYYRTILYYITTNVYNDADAEDLAQDVFIELYKGNGRYDGKGGVEEYLFGIARNIFRRYHRSGASLIKPVPVDFLDDTEAIYDIPQNRSPNERILSDESKTLISEAVSRLPPKAREAIRLTFVEGLRSRKAAQKAGCSVDAFYKRLQRAIKILQRSEKRNIVGFKKK